ncbi:calcium/sodium antiporter [uncultured Phascolarctobacterium sp.]|uniref:calcium/sodium antiporter n=1 Tax=uncultured Phascolarctobacterium sp. TaxID=512296 RepID=UPI0025CB9D3B|nr:calcium/sodium antiporter [uncultured Phascolarctobacterium sp.]
MEILLQFLLLALGFVMLGKGADWFVEGAAALATRFGIPQLVVGLTIVAMGTSAPEAAVSIAAAMKGSADITIGNIVGSNILNILVILGMAAAITPLAVARSTVRVEMPFMIAITVLLFAQGRDGSISLADGLVLAAAFLVYLFYLYKIAMKNNVDDELQEAGLPVGRCLVGAVGGLALIIWGSNVTVGAATEIAKYAGLSERFIGLTIVALGTSLPELFTSVAAARRGNADIAIGNIVGSNIFNILFVVGLSAMIIDIPFAAAFNFDTCVAIGAAVLLWLCVLRTQRLARWGGLLMLGCYAVYLWWIL